MLDSDADLRAELVALFPELEAHKCISAIKTARHVLRGSEARVIA